MELQLWRIHGWDNCGSGCDADMSEIPRFMRRSVRVGGATRVRGRAGGQLLTDWWEVGYITRMGPFRHCSRHMQQISGQS
jgi:hypothetical protein